MEANYSQDWLTGKQVQQPQGNGLKGSGHQKKKKKHLQVGLVLLKGAVLKGSQESGR